MGKGRDKKKKKKKNKESTKQESNPTSTKSTPNTISTTTTTTKPKTAKNKEKETQKTLKTLSKKNKKENSASNNEPVEDIDTILLAFKMEQEIMYTVTEEVGVDGPSRRVNASWSVNPLNNCELIMFGGEYFDGQKFHLFNDYFRYNTEKNEWRKITSPNSPGPRSSHQVVILPTGKLFLFGGEFVSPNETTFFHYKDFWSLDLKTNQWEKLEIKQKPSPRSGHRMTYWKHYLILFGGFYDTYTETRYFDDLWVFDTLDYIWIKLELGEMKPTSRSGHQFYSVYGTDHIVLYGGYCKTVIKGSKSRGIVHSDVWILVMNLDLKKSEMGT